MIKTRRSSWNNIPQRIASRLGGYYMFFITLKIQHMILGRKIKLLHTVRFSQKEAFLLEVRLPHHHHS